MHSRDDKVGLRTTRSLDAKLTKFPDKICARCNNTRTQPHDQAWEILLASLRPRKLTSMPGTLVQAASVFCDHTAQPMLDLRLFSFSSNSSAG